MYNFLDSISFLYNYIIDYEYFFAIILSALLSVLTLIVYKFYGRIIFTFNDFVETIEFRIERENNRVEEEKYRKMKRERMTQKIEEEIESQRANVSYYQQYNQEIKIISINNPIGKWTKMVISERMPYMQKLKELLNGNDNKGFWQSFVRARGSRGASNRARSNF